MNIHIPAIAILIGKEPDTYRNDTMSYQENNIVSISIEESTEYSTGIRVELIEPMTNNPEYLTNSVCYSLVGYCTYHMIPFSLNGVEHSWND